MVLEVRNVTKKFGGVRANSNISFNLEEGEILGLIGPNGSGKTTLLNLISGLLPLSDGEIYFDGQKITGLNPAVIAKNGVARTFQIVRPFKDMSVDENVAIGALFGRKNNLTMEKALVEASKAMEMVGLADKRNSKVGSLTLAQRKRLELARALAMNPKLILLDEVMAGLNYSEIDYVISLIKRINQTGVSIIVIEHVLKVVISLSNRIMVLHHGKQIALDCPEEICNDEKVIKAYLGDRYLKGRANYHC